MMAVEDSNMWSECLPIIPFAASCVRVSGIVRESVVDGPGIRYTVFAQGCSHRCLGCHNPETHNYWGGQLRTVDSILSEIVRNPMLDGFSISGGEPFDQADGFAELAFRVRSIRPELDIWCWTGYTLERIESDIALNKKNERRADWARLLRSVDVLIDGPFIASLAKHSDDCLWRGSSNQRIIRLNNERQTLQFPRS